ncbi:MAG: DUF4372 domain-containing protein, partial [Akkermansia sp.]|nr:DUF4372 domain-containing protein [Akkermansia sp.]
HLIALLFCHMADCQSLRDICKGLQGIRGGINHLGIQKAPSRNALSHQNAKREAMVFRDIYQLLHKRLGQQAFTCRFREGIKASRIMLLDSSVITLCLSMSNLVMFIRIHLMSYIDLWVRINQQEDRSHSPPKLTENCIQGGFEKAPFRKFWDLSALASLRKKIFGAHVAHNAATVKNVLSILTECA